MTAVLFSALLLLSTDTHADTFDLAIHNVTVIDAPSASRTNHTVFVSADRIAAVLPVEEAEGHTATKNLDGTGQYLIPGLWDMHVHIVYEKGLVEAMPHLFLDYGVTSVRDTGALLHKITPQVKRWEALGAEAPDLFFSGPLLDGSLVVYDGEGRPEIGVANSSVESALANFRTLQAAGVDLIKIYELVSPEVFEALVDAAEEAGLPIAAHVPLSMMASTAGPDVGSMEHLRNIEIACADNAEQLYQLRVDELAGPGDKTGYQLRSFLHRSQRTVALNTADPKSDRCHQVIDSLKNTIQVPTIRLNTITRFSPTYREDWATHLQRLPNDVAESWLGTATFYAGQTSELGNRMADWSMALTGEMNARNIPIGAGTDTPIGQAIPGYSLHTELERLVEAGLSNRDALAAATIRPAEFFDLQDRMGQISVGMEADLVLLKQNPLVDIQNTRTISTVISDGKIVR